MTNALDFLSPTCSCQGRGASDLLPLLVVVVALLGLHAIKQHMTRKGLPMNRMRNITIVLMLIAAVAGVFALRRARQAAEPAAPTPTPTEAAATESPWLAKVGDKVIRLADLEAFLATLPPPVREDIGDDKDQILDILIEREVLLQEARHLNLGDTEEYRSALARTPSTPDAKEQALVEALLRRASASLPEPSDDELRAFFEEHRAEVPPGVDFEEIREDIRAHLLQQRQAEWFNRYLTDLKARSSVVVNEAELKRLRPTAAAEEVAPPGAALGIPRLVSLGAGACVPCKMMEPIREELRREYAGRMQVDFIDVWKNRRAGEVYKIRAIPTLVFYAPDGRELARREGYTPKEAILEQWAKLGYTF